MERDLRWVSRRWLRQGCLFALLSAMCLACEGEPADERPDGRADALAMRACAALEDPALRVTAAVDTGEAAGAVIELSETPYLVELPDDGPGYAVLRTVEEHTFLALFTRERDALVALEGPGLGSAHRQAVCGDEIADEFRVHVHEPGDLRLTFSDEGPREVWLAALLGDVGHGAGDAGHHEHHDGGHDHDGGHHHDHDGGHHDDPGDGGHHP